MGFSPPPILPIPQSHYPAGAYLGGIAHVELSNAFHFGPFDKCPGGRCKCSRFNFLARRAEISKEGVEQAWCSIIRSDVPREGGRDERSTLPWHATSGGKTSRTPSNAGARDGYGPPELFRGDGGEARCSELRKNEVTARRREESDRLRCRRTACLLLGDTCIAYGDSRVQEQEVGHRHSAATRDLRGNSLRVPRILRT